MRYRNAILITIAWLVIMAALVTSLVFTTSESGRDVLFLAFILVTIIYAVFIYVSIGVEELRTTREEDASAEVQ